jgi:hypothetical protein
VLRTLARQFTLVTMGSHASQALAQKRLAVRTPSARPAAATGLSLES